MAYRHTDLQFLVPFYMLKKLLAVALLFTVVTFSCPTFAMSSSEANKYQIMSVYMYNFFRYFKWPVGLETDAAPPLTFCSIGNDPFEHALNMIKDKRPYGKPIVIKRHIALQQVDECTMLYVSRSEEKKLPYILSTVSEYPILNIL